MSSPISKRHHPISRTATSIEEVAPQVWQEKIKGLWSKTISQQEYGDTSSDFRGNYQDLEMAAILVDFLDAKDEIPDEASDLEEWGGTDSEEETTPAVHTPQSRAVRAPLSQEEEEEFAGIRERIELDVKIGKFLGRNPKFRLAYGTIIECLKNDLIGRAAIASGYFKPGAYSSPPTHQALAKKAAKIPLTFFTKGSKIGVTGASGLIGAACGITAVAASGLTGGVSIVLEVIPIALALITPVLTTAIDLGGGIAGRVCDEMHEFVFGKVNAHNAKRRGRALAQSGSFTHHDQLNIELAYGFVFLWQKQLEFLPERDVVKFAKAWTTVYLKFIHKNAKALEDMMSHGSGTKFLFEDILWDEIPRITLTNIFNSGNWEKFWPGAGKELEKRLHTHLSKALTTRALITKTGIRCLEGERWHYWSNDPLLDQSENEDDYVKMLNDRRRTRAWLYGHRTFFNKKQAEEFLSLHTNHYLTYDFVAIDRLLKALLALPGYMTNEEGIKIKKETGKSYLISLSHLKGTHPALGVAPAVQQFAPSDSYEKKGERTVLDYFKKNVKSSSAVDQVAYRYLQLVSENPSLFEGLDKHQDQLQIQLMHLVEGRTNSTWEAVRTFVNSHPAELQEIQEIKGNDPSTNEQIVVRLMEIFFKSRMLFSELKTITSDFNKTVNYRRWKNPIEELFTFVKKNKTTGSLLIPCTLANGYNWMLYEVLIDKDKDDKYQVTLLRRLVVGLSQARDRKTKKLEKKMMKKLEKEMIKGLEELTKVVVKFDKKLITEVDSETIDKIRETYGEGPISSGIFVAEYIRCQILGKEMPSQFPTTQTIINMSREQRRLMRYYHRVGPKFLEKPEHYPDLKGLIAEEEVVWHTEEHPIGPPVVTEILR